jgi:hypothetical protein
VTVGARVPYAIPQFSWNKVPGEDEAALLTSLIEIFSLDLAKNHPHIDKTDDSTIRVAAPPFFIEIKLDLRRWKAVATLKAADTREIRNYEYKVVNLLSEITVCALRPSEDAIKDALDVSLLIEGPIFELVSNIQSGAIDNNEVLAQDTKFMTLLEDIHSKFERGYQLLMRLRRNS